MLDGEMCWLFLPISSVIMAERTYWYVSVILFVILLGWVKSMRLVVLGNCVFFDGDKTKGFSPRPLELKPICFLCIFADYNFLFLSCKTNTLNAFTHEFLNILLLSFLSFIKATGCCFSFKKLFIFSVNDCHLNNYSL